VKRHAAAWFVFFLVGGDPCAVPQHENAVLKAEIAELHRDGAYLVRQILRLEGELRECREDEP
jgi:uncharacterized protein (UPF0297 family)